MYMGAFDDYCKRLRVLFPVSTPSIDFGRISCYSTGASTGTRLGLYEIGYDQPILPRPI